MNLSPQEQAILQRRAHIDTKLGKVVVLGFDEDIPAGWERMTMEEGNQLLDRLKTILTEWSIVAYQFGCLTGRGYGFKINQSYGI